MENRVVKGRANQYVDEIVGNWSGTRVLTKNTDKIQGCRGQRTTHEPTRQGYSQRQRRCGWVRVRCCCDKKQDAKESGSRKRRGTNGWMPHRVVDGWVTFINKQVINAGHTHQRTDNSRGKRDFVWERRIPMLESWQIGPAVGDTLANERVTNTDCTH